MLIGEKFNIENIANENALSKFILFECSLPYKIDLDIDIYQMNVKVDLSKKIKYIDKERKIIFIVTHKCLKNQQVPSKKTVFEYNHTNQLYSFFTTDINILIEYFDNDNINEIFKDKELTIILQSALELFASKYNESASGMDFFTPLANETGAQRVSCFEKNNLKDDYKRTNFLMSASYYLEMGEPYEVQNLKSILNEPYNMWKYFFNKAKYAYSRYDNLESVLSSAISLEAYIEELIQKNNLEQSFENYMIQKNKSNKSFFEVTNYLFKKGILTTKSKKNINKLFGKINVMRNDIVHGKITTPILNRENAEKIIEEMTFFYSTIVNKKNEYEQFEYFLESKTYNIKINDLKVGQPMVCNYFTWVADENNIKLGQFTSDKDKFVKFNFDNGVGGLENFKCWLKEKEKDGVPLELHYALEKEIFYSLNDTN